MLVAALFMGIIFAYFNMLYRETRDRIIKTGEMSVLSTANAIDSYLDRGEEVLNVVCYTLESMINEGRSAEEIEKFLINQTLAVSETSTINSVGVYGLICGDYLDGTGWVPDEDYVPEERPWYINAKADPGRVTVTDPYVDAMTGHTLISLSKMLHDEKSVVAMDVELDYLQKEIEELSAQSDSDMAIVLDRNCQVVAHSDRAEIGKNYLEEKETLGGAIVEAMSNTDEEFFPLEYKDDEYIVYRFKVVDDWTCLSVLNTTAVFSQMRSTRNLTIAAVALIIAALLFLMRWNAINNRKARQLEAGILERESRIGEISEVAFRDPLTHVGTKAAFDQFSEEIEHDIRTGKQGAFSVVIMDINDLKKINDSYGHEKGDTYIIGCCKIFCETYKHSRVFRVGGDEFVAVLMGADRDNRSELISCIRAEFAESSADEDRTPYERYCASVGMADFSVGDHDVNMVLKRADRAMYAEKQTYHKVHGRYRQ